MGSSLLDLWHRILGVAETPPSTVVLGAAALALVAVGVRPLWRFTRGFVTIAHEGGHALAALMTGRRLSGIRLHSDASGLTVSRGRPTGIGMIITGLAGYITPSLLGLGSAALLGLGRVALLLWLVLVLLLATLVMIRNVYGVLSVVVAIAAIIGVTWYAPADVQHAFGYLFTWFLLIGGVRPVFELQGSRRRGQARNSDADQVGRLTHTPPLLWVGFFLTVTVGCLIIGGRWLLDVVPLN